MKHTLIIAAIVGIAGYALYRKYGDRTATQTAPTPTQKFTTAVKTTYSGVKTAVKQTTAGSGSVATSGAAGYATGSQVYDYSSGGGATTTSDTNSGAYANTYGGEFLS